MSNAGPAKKPARATVPAAVRIAREARESGDDEDPRRLDRVLGLSYAEAARRLLAPARPALAAAREAVAECASPEEAWETLCARGLVPDAWALDDARQVLVPGVSCARCADRAEYFLGHALDCDARAVPATVEACVALASDVPGVRTVEALARASYALLYDHERGDPRVLWRVGPWATSHAPMSSSRPGRYRAKGRRPGVSEAVYKLQEALRRREDFGVPPGGRRAGPASLVLPRTHPNAARFGASALAGWYALYADWWYAFERDLQAHWTWALSAREQRPNPFTPLVEVWLRGYAVEHFDEEAIVLFALAPRAPTEG